MHSSPPVFEVSVEVARSATARDQSPYLRDVRSADYLAGGPAKRRGPEPLRTRVVPLLKVPTNAADVERREVDSVGKTPVANRHTTECLSDSAPTKPSLSSFT